MLTCLKFSLSGEEGGVKEWQPLLLFVSLRLGLAEINPVYVRQTQTLAYSADEQGS